MADTQVFQSDLHPCQSSQIPIQLQIVVFVYLYQVDIHAESALQAFDSLLPIIGEYVAENQKRDRL